MKRLLRYNPALLSDEELIDGFVVRNVDLKRLLEDVRNNTTAANQHVLVIAPRGMGKTTLVRRLALEVRNDPDLGQRWYPLLFGEETYEVGSTAELWLQALFHLGEQTNDPRWRTAYEELRGDSDDRRLRDRALAELLDFADASGRRILLVIEKDEHGFYAWCPELKGCQSQGTTLEEAIQNIKEAIELYIETLPPGECDVLLSREILTTSVEVNA